ncbi:MAG TPA: hypothetical protein VF776_01595 [Sphingomicrobium sp.]
MTDRGFWVTRLRLAGNVRRLMYQSLIWLFEFGNETRRLRAAFDAENRESLTDALINRVRRDMELGRDLLGTEVLIDEQETIKLAWAQPRDSLGH